MLSEASKSLTIGLEAFNLKLKKLHEEDFFSFIFTLIKLSKIFCKSYLVLQEGTVEIYR